MRPLFQLTDDQLKAIKPLNDRALAASRVGEKGLILLNPREEGVYGVFLPFKYSEKFKKIFREMEAEQAEE